jgi:hypothetical protein
LGIEETYNAQNSHHNDTSDFEFAIPNGLEKFHQINFVRIWRLILVIHTQNLSKEIRAAKDRIKITTKLKIRACAQKL